MNAIEYLSLMDVIKILRKKIVFITFLTILCTSAIVTRGMYFSTYQAYTTAVIVKGDTSIIRDSQYTQGDIDLFRKMVDTYIQIAQSNIVIDKTAEEIKIYSSSELKSMVSAAPSGDTQIIKLKAVSSNRDDVANIANIYCKNFIEQSMHILPVGKIQVLDIARTPSSSNSNSILVNIAIGFLAGLFLSMGIVFFRYYLESQNINNEKQVRDILNIPVLVTIE
jgi:capsular polysaccharide biosynthesis protein